MKVAVLEYLCGGGLLSESNSSSLMQEGLAMLSGLANDLAFCDHEVHTLVDQNTIKSELHFHPQVHIHSLDLEMAWLNQWISIAISVDLVIVIAPELDRQLTDIVGQLRLAGATVLAPSVPFLMATSDKLATSNLLFRSNIAHPPTQTLAQFQDNRKHFAARPQIPMTLKRRDGAGCAEMMVFADLSRLERWLTNHESRYPDGNEWLVQDWLPGRPASMAIIAGLNWKVIGAVEQNIQCDTGNLEGWSPVSYLGGAGPLQGVADEMLEQLAQRVHQAFPAEATGWIGIDFLVPDDPTRLQDFVVIEVNPRLTTSYLGYRKWFGPQLANALLKTPDNPSFFNSIPKTRIEFSVTEFAKNL